MSLDPLMARPTSCAIGGKQTAVIKTSVTDQVSDDFATFARIRGYASASDCLREILLVTMYGPDYMADLHRQRIASLVQNKSDRVPGSGRNKHIDQME